MIRVLWILLLVAVTASAAARDSWWVRRDEGWFFYNEMEEKKEKVPKREKPKAEERGAELFTDRMERAGRILLSRALENPTEENVRAFMEYNKTMLVISGNFARMWQKVLMKYPELLFETNLRYAFSDIAGAIRRLSERAGLYFFYSAHCDSCRRQAVELRRLMEEHPTLTVFAVTLDEILPEFPDSVPDNGAAARLGVRTLPSIFVVYPLEGRAEPLSQGFTDKFDLERRLLNHVQPIENVEEALRRIDRYLDLSASE